MTRFELLLCRQSFIERMIAQSPGESALPKYYMDCFDGKDHLVDSHGIILTNETEARQHAVVLVQSLLAEDVPGEEARIVSVTLRAADGSPIYVAHCAFTGCWMNNQASEI